MGKVSLEKNTDQWRKEQNKAIIRNYFRERIARNDITCLFVGANMRSRGLI